MSSTEILWTGRRHRHFMKVRQAAMNCPLVEGDASASMISFFKTSKCPNLISVKVTTWSILAPRTNCPR